MKKSININASIVIGSTNNCMDLCTISLLYAIFYPFDAIFKNGYHYYETLSTVITVILFGLLQSKVTHKTTEVISKLMKLQLFDAVLVRTNEFESVEANVNVNDVNVNTNGSHGGSYSNSHRSSVSIGDSISSDNGVDNQGLEEAISTEFIEKNDIIKYMHDH